ncbi:putative beta-lysine N-acetyltransferase [Bacillus pinisoli]|uniref:putative beta-lysine N-acetyltransferase n=1 Tax=Bacillus pinisoli TaxID=2901866 RepID=UPI001FF55169|nr:putative beta-lysine N-acetyltransferase [Bacillus pinisoli]
MEASSFYEEKQLFRDNFYLSVCFDHFNRRLRVLDYRGNVIEIANEMITLATQHQYSKAIIYARREHVHVYVEKGFLLEAIFEGFYNGSHAYALTMYFDQERKQNNQWMKEDEILHKVIKTGVSSESKQELPKDCVLRKAEINDAEALKELYSNVFEIYPTPLNDPNYIKKLIKTDSIFYLIEKESKLISAASANLDRLYHNAEISDCATLPEYRKHGIMKHLIIHLEEELRHEKIFCAYSMARSLSYGMNAALQQLRYKYKGRMTNNCYIYNKLEDMNVWVKDLAYD